MSEQETNLVTHPPHNRPRGGRRDDSCARCLELTERVERMEQRLAALEPQVVPIPFGTTPCYWICVSLHGLITFALFSSELTVIVGYPFLYGAVGTLAVCHVFATRPAVEKIVRSFCSISVVVGALILALWLIDESEPLDTLSAVSIYLPLFIVSGWIAAKSLVLTRGWRIVPPAGRLEFSKLKIRDLMIITFTAAGLFGLLRWAIAEQADDVVDQLTTFACVVMIPALISTLIVAFIARAMLMPRASYWLSLAGVIVLGYVVVLLVYFAILFAYDEFESTGYTTFFSYGTIMMAAGLVSPIVTYAMMRSAGYRFGYPSPKSGDAYQGPRT